MNTPAVIHSKGGFTDCIVVGEGNIKDSNRIRPVAVPVAAAVDIMTPARLPVHELKIEQVHFARCIRHQPWLNTAVRHAFYVPARFVPSDGNAGEAQEEKEKGS